MHWLNDDDDDDVDSGIGALGLVSLRSENKYKSNDSLTVWFCMYSI